MPTHCSKPTKDAMRYLIICAYKGEHFVAERPLANMGLTHTVADIADGQIEDLMSVIEFNPAECICHDVTEEIATAVVRLWALRGDMLSDKQYEFVELHLGIPAARSFHRASDLECV